MTVNEVKPGHSLPPSLPHSLTVKGSEDGSGQRTKSLTHSQSAHSLTVAAFLPSFVVRSFVRCFVTLFLLCCCFVVAAFVRSSMPSFVRCFVALVLWCCVRSCVRSFVRSLLCYFVAAFVVFVAFVAVYVVQHIKVLRRLLRMPSPALSCNLPLLLLLLLLAHPCLECFYWVGATAVCVLFSLFEPTH